jgi:hypothetical protein
MKKLTLIVALMASVLLCSVSAQTASPISPPTSSPGPRCKAASWSPEQYTFYGEKDPIVGKLSNLPIKLSDHRKFLHVTQGKSRADVKFYEQEENGKFTVTEWTPKQTAVLLATIDHAIVVNKGEDCVGKQVKDVLRRLLKDGKTSSGVDVPDSLYEALGPPVEQASGEFLKSVLIILC